MFRTSRTASRGRAALTWMGEWRLPGSERRAARSARDVERQILRNEKRMAKLEAERNKAGNPPYHPGAGAGGCDSPAPWLARFRSRLRPSRKSVGMTGPGRVDWLGPLDVAAIARGRGPLVAVQAAASVWRWSLSRLWVAVIRRHSVRTAARPLRWKRSIPRLCLVWPNTGSIIGWRWR